MKKILLVIYLILICISISCRNENPENNEVNPETIYFDYKITAAEGDDNLTIMLQYRDGNAEGETIRIDEPGKVIFDKEQVKPDSTIITGTFYELNKSIASFSGKHTIVFKGMNGKEYKEKFDFQPFSLLTSIPDTIQRNEIFFDFSGLQENDYIRVLLTDTSFVNEGINRIDTVGINRVIITENDIRNLANGPLQLEFIREQDSRIRNGTKAGGKISINYSLKRQFILKG
ncbi:MAG: hypothetical protein ABIO81_04220 [Ginsengibacter sp.]